MKARIYATSEKAWAGMLSAISSAERSVYLEMYIFDDDVTGQTFIRELIMASKRGVKVIMILDVFGSHSISNHSIDQLTSSGVEVLRYSFWFRRTHRKVLIVDEKIAFIGGVNIRKHFASWRDLQIRVTGKVVKSAIRSFTRIYAECGGKDNSLNIKQRKSIFKRTRQWFIERGIGRKSHLLKSYYESRIGNAKQSIILITPYLLPPRWFVAHLHQAVLRNVNVTILMPSASDHRLANRLNRSYASFLSGLGIKCYFSPGTMNHAKAMLIDGVEGVIGSQNLDLLSFEVNVEAGIFFTDKKTIHDLEKIIHKWMSESILFNPTSKDFHWYDVFGAYILRFFGLLPL
jgi:cardiolipin synthase